MQTQASRGIRSVSVFGLGYVGSVTAACLAHKGNRVIGVDTNPAKVDRLNSGRSPILETGLDELVASTHRACRLHATTDVVSAVSDTDISFICVSTPSLRTGKLDTSSVERVCHQIGQALSRKETFHLVVVRSTILPGTSESVVIPTLEAASGKRHGAGFGVCVNPEFMREGSSITDFFHPAVMILGAADPNHLVPLRELFEWVSAQVFETTLAAAEMAKYVSNAFHALKVSFANEVGTLCKEMAVDAEEVTKIFLSDTKLNISPAYLTPGFAFGGSCLPKDLRALTYRAQELDLRVPLLNAILPSNFEHLERVVETVLRTGKKKVGVLGLSFKAKTDDLRGSPHVQVIKRLLGEGCNIQVWDPPVALGQLVGSNRQFIEDLIPHIGTLLNSSLQEVVGSAEVVIVGTNLVKKDVLASCLRQDTYVIDLVNLNKEKRQNGREHYEGICW